MFRVGYAYKHVKFTDSFVVVLGIRSHVDSVVLDVGYWVQPVGWRPVNTCKYGEIEVQLKDIELWVPYIVGLDRCSFRQAAI